MPQTLRKFRRSLYYHSSVIEAISLFQKGIDQASRNLETACTFGNHRAWRESFPPLCARDLSTTIADAALVSKRGAKRMATAAIAAKAMLMTEIWFGVMGVFRRSAVSRFAKLLWRAAIGRRSALGLSPASGTSFIFAQNRMLQIYDCSES